MKVKITPTEKIEVLRDNLEKRVDSAEIVDDQIKAEVDDPEVFERVPGIDTYTVEDEEHEGLKGRPVQEQAYARIESKEDLAKALLATINGYNLVVLETDMEWDLRLLKRFNPDIKEVKSGEPVEELDIEKSVNVDGLEDIGVDLDDEEVDTVYSFMML